MFRRHHAIVTLLCLPALAVLGAGCSDDVKDPPRVIFEGRLERSAGGSCNDVGPLFEVGTFGTPALEQKPAPINDGAAFGQGEVSVSCSVVPAGADAFNVDATVVLSGALGGTFRVDGKFTTSGEQTGVHAVFANRRSGNTYEQKDAQCIVRYAVSPQGVAAGRVWGEIECPTAENTGAQTSCKAVAQFRFENCIE